MKKLVWYYDQPGDNTVVDDIKYRKAHRKTARIKECLRIVNGWKDCESILDVGCKSLGFIELVGPQYKQKMQMDHYLPPIVDFSKGTFRYTSDLHTYYKYWDVVVCMEVMEHVEPDKRRVMAGYLLAAVDKYLLISIPYNWGKGREIHPHQGYNESNIMEWFYPHLPDWTKQVGCHLIACFDKQKEEVIKQGLK